MYCYLAQSKNHNLTKIGFSKNPAGRKRQIQVSEKDKSVDFIHVALGGNGLEKKLHNFFKDKRIRGEWFCLSESDVLQAKLMMIESVDVNSIDKSNLVGQWFKMPDNWQAEAKAQAALERVNLSEWIADAVFKKLQLSRDLSKGVENEQKNNEVQETI